MAIVLDNQKEEPKRKPKKEPSLLKQTIKAQKENAKVKGKNSFSNKTNVDGENEDSARKVYLGEDIEKENIEKEVKDAFIEEVVGEVKEKVVAVKRSEQLEDLVQKILLYCETQAGTKLYDYQRTFGERIIECLVTNSGDELTALFSRQSGKTETVAVILGGCMVILPSLAKMLPDVFELRMYEKGLWVGIFAPSNEQSYTAFTRLREKLRSSNAKAIMNDPEIDTDFEAEKGNPMILTNGSLCRMQSAAKQSQIESKSYHVVLVDECQDVDNTKIKKSIHPMLAAYNGLIIKIGTSNTRKSDFYDAIRRNIRDEQNYGARQNHFQYDYKVVSKFNNKYKTYVEKEIGRLGFDSDEFRMAYRLHFILERGMFISQEEFEDTLISPVLKHKTEELVNPCVAGLDVAKSGDSTVLTVLEIDWKNGLVNDITGERIPMKYLVNWLELSGEKHEEQFWQIVEFLKNYNITAMFVDSTGMGDPVADRFANYYNGRIHVEGYQFSRPSKSVMWKNLYQEITGGRLKVAGHPRTQRLRPYLRFRAQMLDLEKDYVGQYMVCQHPAEKGAHDDFCDSLGLANLAAMTDFMPEVMVSDNPFYNTRSRTDEKLFGKWR